MDGKQQGSGLQWASAVLAEEAAHFGRAERIIEAPSMGPRLFAEEVRTVIPIGCQDGRLSWGLGFLAEEAGRGRGNSAPSNGLQWGLGFLAEEVRNHHADSH